MKKQILVDIWPEETRMALLEAGQLAEAVIERVSFSHLVGNVYKGKVKNVLPGMQAAFIDIGREKNAFLYVGEPNKAPQEYGSRVLKPTVGQDLLIQILKDEIGTKGPRATTHISLPGRYVVLMPTVSYIGISRRIEDAAEKERLRGLAEQLKPADMGLIVRTVAAGQSEAVLAKDIAYLTSLWHAISARAKITKSPALLYHDADLVIRLVRDSLDDTIEAFVVNHKQAYERVIDLVRFMSPNLLDRIHYHEGNQSLFNVYGVEESMERIGQRTVELPSGGYIVIDKTEALTVIDVNTGRFIGRTSLADTVLTTNLEAAAEIARQLRLRDIGGIIIIDFIDMDKTEDQQQVLSALEQHLKQDRTKTNILGLTQLGLVEMTRKKTRQNVESTLFTPCPCCKGRGRIPSPETVALRIKRKLRNLAAQSVLAGNVRIQVHPAVAAILSEKEALTELETAICRKVLLETVDSFDFASFSLLYDET
ncbi:MAG: Rne/Rng family ribonuclease [Sporomusaceae bacterium]|nr:Rne/Rng family ribonuclease [Sporomusaceae bacterium]